MNGTLPPCEVTSSEAPALEMEGNPSRVSTFLGMTLRLVGCILYEFIGISRLDRISIAWAIEMAFFVPSCWLLIWWALDPRGESDA